MRRTLTVYLILVGLAPGARLSAQEAHDPTSIDLAPMQHRLGIPSSIATVTGYHGGTAKHLPDFILIQDVHHHPDVQNEIAAILLNAKHHWGVTSVFIEGAFERLPAQTSSCDSRSTLGDRLRSGELNGPQLAASMAPGAPLTLWGMEDPKLYQANIAAFREVERNRPAALRELNTLKLLRQSFGLGSENSSAPSLDQIEKLLKLKLRAYEYQALQRQVPQFPSHGALARTTEAALRYYQLADARSVAFLKNIKESAASGTRVIVVGGFHTTAMTEALTADGHSFAVLTPQVTRGGYEGLHDRRMQETADALQIP